MNNSKEGVSRIENVYTQDLIPYEKNPRKHGKAIAALKESIERHGFTNPIIIDQKNRIIAGHGRLQAAKELGRSTVPCVRVTVDDRQYHELLISDNKIAELSKWDNDLLKECLTIMGDLADLSIPGFDPSEVDKLFGHNHTDVSASPAAQDEPDFGDSGTPEPTTDDRALVKRKIFMFTKKEYKIVDSKLKAIKKENGFETEVEALMHALKPYKGLQQVTNRKGGAGASDDE
jgi:hypothetical protein